MTVQRSTILFGILTAIAVAVCVRLGIWQLDRLQERRAQNSIVQERGNAPALSLRELQGQDTAVTHWRRVRVEGVADYAHEMVHATRSQNGSPGVHLLTPIRPIDGSWGDTAIVLLRGYLYAADGRTVDLDKARESDTLRLDALVTSFPPVRAGTARMASGGRALRLLDRDTLATMMERPLGAMVLLALGDTIMQDISRPTRVPPPTVNDGPHLSYALQWFGFATVFAVGFLVFARGRKTRPRAASTQSAMP
ncbi:MAG: SURF1 family protein [Gemmatimonadaceae bacterium]|nr:SURF1 family protein [Gemmatimonadaceae bacterium]